MAQHGKASAAPPQSGGIRAIVGRHGLFWIGGGVLALAAILFSVLLFLPSGQSGSPGILKIGQRAPVFTIDNVSGQAVSLASERGHPVILNFWATYCQPCQTETPLLQHTMLAHQNQHLVILGIDQGEEVSAIAQYGKDYDLSYPLLADVNQQVNHLFGVTGLPVSYFIDSQGTIRYIVNGVLSPSTLSAGLAAIGITG